MHWKIDLKVKTEKMADRAFQSARKWYLVNGKCTLHEIVALAKAASDCSSYLWLLHLFIINVFYLCSSFAFHLFSSFFFLRVCVFCFSFLTFCSLNYLHSSAFRFGSICLCSCLCVLFKAFQANYAFKRLKHFFFFVWYFSFMTNAKKVFINIYL